MQRFRAARAFWIGKLLRKNRRCTQGLFRDFTCFQWSTRGPAHCRYQNVLPQFLAAQCAVLGGNPVMRTARAAVSVDTSEHEPVKVCDWKSDLSGAADASPRSERGAQRSGKAGAGRAGRPALPDSVARDTDLFSGVFAIFEQSKFRQLV